MAEMNEISSELIRLALRQTVENKLNSKKCKIDVNTASKAGTNNFIGIVYRATFWKDEDDQESEKKSMIVKVAPIYKTRREIFISRPSFLREIFMYEKVSRNSIH